MRFLGDRLTVFSYIVSIALHFFLVLFFPEMQSLVSVEKTKWLEVDIVIEDTDTLLKPNIDTAEHGTQHSGGKDENSNPRGDSPLFPAPPINLPQRLNEFTVEEPLTTVTLPADLLPEIAGYGTTLQGLTEGDSDSEQRFHISQSPPDLAWQPKQSDFSGIAPEGQTDIQIEGPASRRVVVYRPPAPRPVANTSGTVQLSFVVYADGTVGNIVPIKRADPELENVAIEYLKKWRFQIVSGAQKDQGTIQIRFKLQ
ncbi:TonB family protein [bacterium]|nr:TonB family protein [candidate division CSSED10-310 bacterium]